MPVHKFTADQVHTLTSDDTSPRVIVTDDTGRIADISPLEDHDPASVQKLQGVLCPGFINTHCHLELSHMKGLVDTGIGLLPFLKSVVQYRDFPEDIVQQAIADGDEEMRRDGIVAVGDISNKIDTAAIKEISDIRYYTFVEMFDFLQPALTNKTIEQYTAVFHDHSDDSGNAKSFVPHAPYTVSDELYEHIRQQKGSDLTISIHNQETAHEDRLFLNKSGGFLDFYEGFGFDLNHFEAPGTSSLSHAIKRLDPKQRTLFVHNTMTTAVDIKTAQSWSSKVHWATCANANLYIENQLPDYRLFTAENARMTIGTDSLTSNWQLSIMEEIKAIKKYKSYLNLTTLLTWACKNGAEALGFQDELGTLEIGKQPGLVNITGIQYKGTHEDLSQAISRRVI